ncbi:MAG: hypothetical protein J5918_01605 [Prevotella sp.]|nr:hypothetical protein [Prevotella sp.]
MKHFVTILFLILSLSISGFAQEPESAKPLTDTEVLRKVAIMDIEGQIYDNVVVTMKSTSPDYIITDKYKVKVTITDANGKKIWKKTLKNVFLYVFSDGQVQVGKQNFDRILIRKSSLTGDFIGKIREKEGIY